MKKKKSTQPDRDDLQGRREEGRRHRRRAQVDARADAREVHRLRGAERGEKKEKFDEMKEREREAKEKKKMLFLLRSAPPFFFFLVPWQLFFSLFYIPSSLSSSFFNHIVE